MKGLCLTTRTPDTEKLVRSFTAVVPDTAVVRYDVFGADVGAIAEQHRPDVIVYIGACMPHQDGCPIPTTDALWRANGVAPMVHICSDAADPPWWPLLEEYDRAGAFRLQVAIDGSRENPIARFGLVALTPVDPGMFNPLPWPQRGTLAGFCGGGGARTPILQRLASSGLVWLNPGAWVSYPEVCAFYSGCRIVINDARTGTGQKRHVKGRFVEASLAGACLLEPSDSPARTWFEPGVDFLEYGSDDHAEQIIRAAPSRGDADREMAERMRGKMLERHAARPFWTSVFERIGLQQGSEVVQHGGLRTSPQGSDDKTAPLPTEKPGGAIFAPPTNPQLLATVGSMNLVSYDGGVYVVPHRLGSLDLATPSHRNRPGIVRYETLEEAEGALPWLR
jgi:hypothetical protein